MFDKGSKPLYVALKTQGEVCGILDVGKNQPFNLLEKRYWYTCQSL